MLRLLIIFTFLFPLSCVSKPILNPDLYSNYTKLSNSTISGEIVNDRKKYFTSQYLSDVSIKEKNSLFVLKLTNYIDSINSQYQEIDGNFGCLTVNGFDEEKKPVSLFVEYKKLNSNWLVNYMYLNFIENENKFTKKAVCPRDFEGIKHNKTN